MSCATKFASNLGVTSRLRSTLLFCYTDSTPTCFWKSSHDTIIITYKLHIQKKKIKIIEVITKGMDSEHVISYYATLIHKKNVKSSVHLNWHSYFKYCLRTTWFIHLYELKVLMNGKDDEKLSMCKIPISNCIHDLKSRMWI